MYFTIGDLSIHEYNEAKKHLKIKLENFPFFPLDLPQGYCSYLAGYYSSIMQVIVGGEATGEIIKCSHQGDKYHEVLIRWD
jgi:hypothetical protein